MVAPLVCLFCLVDQGQRVFEKFAHVELQVVLRHLVDTPVHAKASFKVVHLATLIDLLELVEHLCIDSHSLQTVNTRRCCCGLLVDCVSFAANDDGGAGLEPIRHVTFGRESEVAVVAIGL